MKTKIIFFCLIFWIFPALCFAEFGEKFNVDGYYLHISATQLSDKLIVSGDIKGGEPCSLLKIYMFVFDDKGNSTIVSEIVKNYRNSDRFTIKKKYSKGGYWTVKQVSISKN